jgi:hypothetical protein
LLRENIQWIGGAVVPVFWLVFAMEYTGYDELLDRTVLGALSVVPGVTIIAAWTNQRYGLMWTANGVVIVDGLALLDQAFGPWFWVNVVYTIGLIGIGSLLLLRLIVRSDYLHADQSLLLVLGVTVPVVAIVLSVFETPLLREPLLYLTPYASAVTGVPDERWSERVVACIVPAADAALTDDAMLERCGDRSDLADFQRPKEVRFLDDLPRSATMKVQKFKLEGMSS